jgi:cytochrome c oxidase assembly protein subunit 15
LLGLALWQFGTGLSNVVLGWPLIAAVSHTGGAAALVVVLTGALMTCRRAADPSTAPSPLPSFDSPASRLSA